jgi:5S rRNA maturation endonuclease (ribonuclease M5)
MYIDPLITLRLLAENPKNLDLDVVWRTDFAETYMVDNFQKENLSMQDKYLIITEGSSDLEVISKGILILEPDLKKFFNFIDMNNNYPFGGTSNLFKFYDGLKRINVLNKVIVVIDNDTEGNVLFNRLERLDPVSNLGFMKLPDLPELNNVVTIGTDGEHLKNINGKASAIECYLDFNFNMNSDDIKIRWIAWNDKLQQYQGRFDNKTKKMLFNNFLNYYHDSKYDLSKLQVLVNQIIFSCIELN